MTALELEYKIDMLGALESFKRNLWHEWQETLSEHVAHMNKIGITSMHDYVFMAFKWEDSEQGFEYWYAVANAFRVREKTTLINDGDDRKKDFESHDDSGKK